MEIVRRAGRVGRRARAAGALQIEQQRSAGRSSSAWTHLRSGDVRAVRATEGHRTEAAGRGGRRIAQEPGDTVEDVAAREEPAEHLIVQRVHPLAADFDRVAATNPRQVVLDLKAPRQLIDARLQEVGVAESKGGSEAHPGVRREIRRHRAPGTRLARVRHVKLIQPAGRQGREPVCVDHVDARRVAFRAVGRRPVRGDVERLVLLAGVIEVIGNAQPVVRVEIDVVLEQQRHGLDRMLDRQAFVLTKRRLEEVQQRAGAGSRRCC